MPTLKLSYDAKKVLESVFNTSTPTPGKIYLFELDAVDENDNLYRLQVSQNAIIPEGATVVRQTANYSIFAQSNPNKQIAYITFAIPTFVDSGDFVQGSYCSSNGSKITIDETPIRKLCVKL